MFYYAKHKESMSPIDHYLKSLRYKIINNYNSSV